MPPDSATETPVQHHEITLVTAYFQLDNSGRNRAAHDYRTSSDYHDWMANLLPFVRWPMVIFCDAQSVDMIKRLRGDKPTVYHVTHLQEFSAYRHRDVIRAQIAAKWPGFNPDIALVWNEKANFVRRAIAQNAFDSEMFFWCDIGAFRTGKRVLFNLSERIEYPNLRVCRTVLANRVGLFGTPPGPSPTARLWVRAGYWGGKAAPLRQFCNAYYDCLAQRIERGDFVHTDEPVFRDTANAPSVNAHVFTGDDIRWLPRLRFLAPPPRFGDGLYPVVGA